MLRIHIGCELKFVLPQSTPMIVMLNAHFSRFSDLEYPDRLATLPAAPVEGYRNSFGNWCALLHPRENLPWEPMRSIFGMRSAPSIPRTEFWSSWIWGAQF